MSPCPQWVRPWTFAATGLWLGTVLAAAPCSCPSALTPGVPSARLVEGDLPGEQEHVTGCPGPDGGEGVVDRGEAGRGTAPTGLCAQTRQSPPPASWGCWGPALFRGRNVSLAPSSPYKNQAWRIRGPERSWGLYPGDGGLSREAGKGGSRGGWWQERSRPPPPGGPSLACAVPSTSLPL